MRVIRWGIALSGAIVISIGLFTVLNILTAFISRGYVFIKYSRWVSYTAETFADDVRSGMIFGSVFGVIIFLAWIFFNRRNHDWE